ncbi:MAG: hypothetical protein KBT46_06795, partial [Ruminococcus sp.]|nr:hypothetical protein [Candidatus Copronaster equi]
MKKILVTDVTLRECMKTQHNLSFKEKIEIAKLLDKLCYDYIEMPEIKNFTTDTLLIKTISGLLNHSGIVVPVGLDKDKISAIYDCAKSEKKPVLKVSVPVSTVQMEYLCGKKPPKMLELISELVSECKKFCDEVEFSAEDAFRAERDFLYSAVNTALEAGATKITVCNSDGMALPDECSQIINDLYKNTKINSDIIVSADISSEINMECSAMVSAISAGAGQIYTTADDFGYPTIGVIFKIFSGKGDLLDIESSIRTVEIQRVVSQIKSIISVKDIASDVNVSIKSENINTLTLDKTASISEVIKAVEKIGYELSAEDKPNIYEAFKRVANKKEYVGTKELEAIIASSTLQVPPTYTIENYVINSGNVITATANIKLKKKDAFLSGVSTGDGPIDAAFLAIEQIVGHHYELDDFQIRAVTEGREAMGSALVKLRSTDGK